MDNTPQAPPQASAPSRPASSRFVRACLRLPVDRTPVWFLRQAGRYMPEYRSVRRHHSLLDICRTPALAAEVTITAAERLGVDAAIIFADLLLPFAPLGLDFEFVAGEGPVVHTPVRTLDHVKALRTDRTDDLLYVARALEKVAAHFNQRASRSSSGLENTDAHSSKRASRSSSGLQAAENAARIKGALALAASPQDQLGIIGFCGAPFTLASYMIEGGSSRSYIETKKLMYASGLARPASPQPCHPERSAQRAVEGPRKSAHHPDPPSFSTAASSGPWALDPGPSSAAWPLLMEKLVTVLADFARQQVEAGADVIQVFDSWAGALSVSDYRQYCLAPTTDLIQRIKHLGVPVIYFGVDTASLLSTFRETGADVLGLDWRIPLDEGWRAAGTGCAIQGNLDPITLFAPEDVLEARVKEILTLAAGRPGHIFNLGHGIVPATPVEAVLQTVNAVKRFHLPPTHL